MRQVFQDMASGATSVQEVPAPRCGTGMVLIRSKCSLVSAGTERSLVEFGRAGLLEKARKQPDRVRMVLDKARTDGLLTTIEAVRSKLREPLALGYSSVGEVLDVGAGVTDLKPGDRVVSNGPHAEVVCVPRNLCAPIPDGVPDQAAAFSVVSSIGLQGIRLAQPTLGETFVVTGLGLIGLLTAQMLVANGCRVIGLDIDEAKLALARTWGVQTLNVSGDVDAVAAARALAPGGVIDGVLITASSSSNELVREAAGMCRKRGRIVLVGVVGLELQRDDFYEKELSFQVSCSYGPGRYDSSYEEGGTDYPLPFVRWTENRNFSAILDLMAAGRLVTDALVSGSFSINDAPAAYDHLVADRGALGVLLEYPEGTHAPTRRTVHLSSGPSDSVSKSRPVIIGAIGAGNYAGRVLLPAFASSGCRLKTVVSSSGRTGTAVGRRLGFEASTTDVQVLLDDPEIDAVVVGTRHDSHARFVEAALDAGKAVFVEKPLALTRAELDRVAAARERAIQRGDRGLVMVGFNRRWAPSVVAARNAMEGVTGPMAITYLCNAGAIPADSWVHDPQIGGGRILGEACHFVDLARFLAGAPLDSWSAQAMTDDEGLGDSAVLSLGFEGGSVASVQYFANGSKAFPKERIDVFRGGRIVSINNFRSVSGFGVAAGSRLPSLRQNKGNTACVDEFVKALRTGSGEPIPFAELYEVARVMIELAAATLRPQA